MVKIYIENYEVSIENVFSDEWVYGESKINKDFQIVNYTISVNLSYFEKIISSKYDIIIKELKDDDEMTGENFALDTYEMVDYPTFKEILNCEENSSKIKFINDFVALSILYEFTNKVQIGTNINEWILKVINSINTQNELVIIKGKAQPIR